MSATSTQDPVERVVAWHNRHPLALRIGRQHVAGLGWLALPFAAAGAQRSVAAPAAGAAASLRERAMALAQPAADPAEQPSERAPEPALADGATLVAAFSEDLLAPLPPEAIARFALGHGRREEPMDPSLPRRQALVDSRLVPPGHALLWLHLPTAAVQAGTRRQRVLIGAGSEGEVLGRRLIGRTRLAATALVVGVAAAGVGLLWHGWGQWASAPAALEAAARPASAAAANAASHPSGASATPAVADTSIPSAATATPSAEPASKSSSPLLPTRSSTPSLAEPAPPGKPEATASIRPHLDPEVARIVRNQAAALRAASAAGMATALPAASAPSRPAAASPVLPVAAAASPSSSSGPTYALVARTTRSRAASMVLLGAISAEAGRDGKPPRAEVLSAEGGYRAGLWPFGSREQALRTQQRLREAGLETELVSF